MNSKSKVLIVDDDRNICELIGLYLQKEGYEVLYAYNGINAVDTFKMQTPSLVVLDIMLPGIDGWQ